MKYCPEPIYFLAGPIRGGGDWQAEACNLLNGHIKEDFTVAVPCRWDLSHPLFEFSINARFCPSFGGQNIEFERQTDWERFYLEIAACFPDQDGCIIFWLGKQVAPRPLEQGPYARDTYGELGEWRGRLTDGRRRCRLVIGAHPDFSGLSVIRRNYAKALRREESEIIFHSTLETTIEAAVLKKWLPGPSSE